MTMETFRYRREIDGLRAIAVLPVILFHAGTAAFSGGFAGVDVFFVISGYLITSVILGGLESGNFKLSDFYERRARRILPALLLTAVLCVPFAWSVLPPRDMLNFSQSLVAVPLFASNILFWLEGGYFEPASELKPLLHTWSLSLEEQFYLLYPMSLLIAWRLGRRSIPVALSVAALASFAAAEGLVRTHPSAAFFMLPFRVWELAAGALVAISLARGHDVAFGRTAREIGSVAGLALIGLAVILYGPGTPFPGAPALVPVLGAALVVFFTRPETLVGRILGAPLLVSIGLASYSAYLIHQPLLVFARYAFDAEPGGPLLLVLSILSIALGFVSWRYVELRFRNPDKIPRARFIRLAIFSSALLLVFGLVGHKTDGFLFQRLSPDMATLLRSASVSPVRARCHTGGMDYRAVERSCVLNTGGSAVATFGDSHTVELAYALARKLAAADVRLAQFSFSSCSPKTPDRVSETYDPCTQWSSEALARIVGDHSVRTVVISYRIVEYLRLARPDRYEGLNDATEQGQEKVWRAYLEVMNRLLLHGKKVILVLQAPELEEDIQSLVFKSENQAEDIVGADRRWWEDRRTSVTGRLSDIPHEVVVIDPADVFCDLKSCHATRDGKALYFDDHHISLAGAELVAEQVYPHLEIGASKH
jgi:peptidoglycan/LPS O-acetylase OafA/YrhL